MKKVSVKDAVNMILCHDLTKIVPGEFKGAAFKKGHVIKEEDIPELLNMGKDHIYVWEAREGMLHEDDAALRLAQAAVKNGVEVSEAREGKVNLIAQLEGLLKINVFNLTRINGIGDVSIATLHTNRVVNAGTVVTSARVIPLVIEESKIKEAEEICANSGGLVEVIPIRPLKVGIVTTGNEVFYGRIQDKFGPVLKYKVSAFGCEVIGQIYAPDDIEKISAAVKELISQGAELVLTSGGMSVDPDDVTPAGVRAAGGQVVVYGAPVMPGSMMMVAYLDDIPVLGLPGCVMFNSTTVFDLVLPRVLAGERINRQDIDVLGHGGLCINCPTCSFPHCPFGKGQ
ncbi:MAG: molybdopterin-binding protein [Thermincola sp.]|jgi:molybdenum cofactor synthesis domain-containing protein|nr:molybdopterin-binding protein [Thermincola sp.]MDT3702545.1 molybdopterin-binding protein [Thermincola sp.]